MNVQILADFGARSVKSVLAVARYEDGWIFWAEKEAATIDQLSQHFREAGILVGEATSKNGLTTAFVLRDENPEPELADADIDAVYLTIDNLPRKVLDEIRMGDNREMDANTVVDFIEFLEQSPAWNGDDEP